MLPIILALIVIESARLLSRTNSRYTLVRSDLPVLGHFEEVNDAYKQDA
jgi:hypothetical protein